MTQQSRREALERVATAAREYLDERENPAPDYTMRRALRERLREALRLLDET